MGVKSCPKSDKLPNLVTLPPPLKIQVRPNELTYVFQYIFFYLGKQGKYVVFAHTFVGRANLVWKF